MVAFILVHGTWAKHAPWTLPGSLIRNQIEETVRAAKRSTRFELVPWGGHNFGRSRLAAAQGVADKVKAINSAENHEKIFLIGHSHGGSAIAYFLKRYPELASGITGVAFLSTPFIATRVRPQWKIFFNSLIFSLTVLMLTVIYTGVFFGLLAIYPYPALSDSNLAGFVALVFISVTLTAYLLWRRANAGITLYIEGLLPRKLNSLATTNLPAGDYLFLRAMGDEAASILSLAHFFSWVISTIGIILSIPILQL